MAKKRKTGVPKTMPMRVLEERGIPFEVRKQVRKQFTAEGVAEDLGVPVAWVVKAMIVQRSDGQFALIVIPGDRQLSLKKAAGTLNDKSLSLAQARDVERVTGYQVGAVSVVGFRRTNIPTYFDRALLDLNMLIISSGRPDAGLAVAPADLKRAMDMAEVGDFCQ
jgi:Cys-tRNA(Pro)/Cys-tRNA(Cys) deacylase